MRFFQNNESAVELAFLFSRIAHVWDDLIDKDKPVTDADINEVFWIVLVQVPGNAFYRRYVDELRPVITTSVLNYVASNDMEKKADRHSLEISHVTRYAISDVMLMISAICGGRHWAMEIGSELRLFCQKDTLEHYLSEKLRET